MSEMNDREVLDAILYALKAHHAEMVAFKDETYNQFAKMNNKLDNMDSEIRAIKRQNKHMNTDIDSALDRIERIERTIDPSPV